MAENSCTNKLNKIELDIKEKSSEQDRLNDNLSNSSPKDNDKSSKDDKKSSKSNKKKSSKRCNHPDCKRKLKLTDIECRCGLKFCTEHRYAGSHDCTFDYKKFGRDILEKSNPQISFAKCIKI